MAGLEGLFSAFVRRGSRVESIRIMGTERQGEVGWVYKDFLAGRKTPSRRPRS